MFFKYVHPDYGLIEVRVCALSDVVVKMFLVTECVHTLEHKLEQRFQVFGTRAGHKNIGIAMPKGSGDG